MAVRPSEVTKCRLCGREGVGNMSKEELGQREREGGKEIDALGEKFLYEILEGG